MGWVEFIIILLKGIHSFGYFFKLILLIFEGEFKDTHHHAFRTKGKAKRGSVTEDSMQLLY